MTDPDGDPVRPQDRVTELAAAIAELLGPERDSEITAHLARVAARQAPDPLPALDAARHALTEGPGVPTGMPERRSRRELVEAVQQLSAEVAAQRATLDLVLGTLADSLRAGTHHHPDIEGELDAIHDRFATAERNRAWTPTDLDVATRLEAIERAQQATEFHPWYRTERFEAAFRGSQEALDARYQDLADTIAAHGGPVLDLGCGAGDMLALIAARGVECRGVDTDVESVARARTRGLQVDRGDALEALAAVAPASLGGLVLIQVVEHLSAQQLVELVVLAADKVRPGGVFVAETINPASLYVYGHALYLDPTHSTPIHPAYLRFLCEEAGFTSVDVQMRSHPPTAEKLARVEGGDATIVDGVNRTIDHLNDLLYGPQDYAVLATR